MNFAYILGVYKSSVRTYRKQAMFIASTMTILHHKNVYVRVIDSCLHLYTRPVAIATVYKVQTNFANAAAARV